MGNVTRTVQNLEIIQVDMENNCILVKGNVPGAKKSLVIIKTAVKNPNKKNTKADLISYEEKAVETTTEEVETTTENAE